MYDIVGLGELLIDFTPMENEAGDGVFKMNAGGAPPNCLTAFSVLGGKAALIAKVGDDFFGDFLIEALNAAGVSTLGVAKTHTASTTLAFVALSKGGERRFHFVRQPGADILLEKADIDRSLIDAAHIFHFGTLSFTDLPAREATLYALDYAKKAGKTISFDPNYRAMLWENEASAIEWMRKGLAYADIIKVSEEEMALITGLDKDDFQRGAAALLDMGVKTALITYGARGAYFTTETEQGFVEGFKVTAVDTTGCGDAFMGAMLYLHCKKPEMPMADRVRFANAVGALCATKKGGVPAMPTYEETVALMGTEE